MDNVNDSDRSDRLALQALGLMKRHGVPPNPRNYAVWYGYCQGDDPALKDAVEKLMAAGAPVAAQKSPALYEKFCAPEAAAEMLKQATGLVEKAVGQVLNRLSKAGDDAAHYGEVLGQYKSVLTNAETDEQIRSTLGELIGETHKMQVENDKLETDLKASSAKIAELRQALEDVRRDAMVDGLTGIANRKAFDSRLREAMAGSQRGAEMCLLMIDIDFFKRFNDTYGHQLGDEVLKLVARTLTECVKGRDMPARYGGEEFAIILPQTALAEACTVAEQVRLAVASKRIVKRTTGQQLGTITLSVGVAQHVQGEDAEDLVRRADEALYSAKRTGRNRFAIAETCAVESAAPAAAMVG